MRELRRKELGGVVCVIIYMQQEDGTDGAREDNVSLYRIPQA